MKTTVVISAAGLIALAAWLTAPAAGAALVEPGHFRVMFGIASGHTVSDLAVTPDDRYALVISKEAKTLRFIDAWDFSLLEGPHATLSIGDPGEEPLCVAVSPDGKFAYLGLSSGRIAIVNLEPLSNLLPYQTLAEDLSLTYAELAPGNAISVIAALPEVTGKTDNVYLLAGGAGGLWWARLSGGSSPAADGKFINVPESLAVARGKKFGYALYRVSDSRYLMVISCADNLGRCEPASVGNNPLGLTPTATDFLGLAPDPVDDQFALTMNLDQQKLHLIDTWPIDTMHVADSYTVGEPAAELALLVGTTARYDQAVTAFGNTVTVSEVDGSSLKFTGWDHQIIEPSLNFTTLAAASGKEGHVYAGTATDEVHLVSANPFIDDLTVIGGTTLTVADGVTVALTIRTLLNGITDYLAYKNKSFGAWSDPLFSETINITTGASAVSAWIEAASLEECENVVTVIARDRHGQRGRDAITIYKDTPPPKPSFKLGFGDRELIVSFTAHDPCDLDRYEIFHGDEALAENADYDLIAANYEKRTIDNPTDGKKYEVRIKNLENGVRYYAYLVIFDQSGHRTISGPKSAIPQRVSTLSELADEKGGVDCLGSVSGSRSGDWRSAALLLIPLFLAAGLSVAARRRK